MKYVVGYASLLSEVSIKRLFPDVGAILPVKIKHHARCFNSFGTLSLSSGLAEPASKHLAHASAILRPNCEIKALAFELNEDDYQTYARHEFRYDLKSIEVISLSKGEHFEAIICYENVDHRIDCSRVGAKNILDLYERYKSTSFWHTNHLPADIYLEHCIASARNISPEFISNFLETSFLSDRVTSIQTYLEERETDLRAYVKAAELSVVF